MLSLLIAVGIQAQFLQHRRSAFCPVASAGTFPSTNNLVGHWRLNSDGTDAHTSGNNLTEQGSVTYVAGTIGNAAHILRAENDYLDIADNASLSLSTDTDFAIACWVKLASKQTRSVVLGKGKYSSTTDTEYVLYYKSDADSFRLDVGSGSAYLNVVSTVTVTTGVWYFIVAWHEASNNLLKISVNDQVTPDQAAYAINTQDGDSNLYLGNSEDGTSYELDGDLDSVSLWIGRYLSAAEITALYNGGAGVDYPY